MRLPASRRRDESGVIAIVVSLITCFTLIPIAAFAVDIGVQRVARRDMQAVADVVALDLARHLGGQTYSQLQPGLQDRADKSAARNDAHAGGAPIVRAELGTVDASHYDPAHPDAYFTPITSDADGLPTAVRVTASTTVDFSIQGGRGGAGRTAIARAEDNACFRLGSFAARVSTSGSLLNGLLNDSLNLTVVGYQGLATSSITLGDLAAELGAGTPDELMALNNLSLGTLFSASAHVLQTDGGDAANVTLLNSMAASSFSGVTNTHIAFSDLIDLASGADAAMSTSINLYDLVATTAFVANGSNFLAVPNVTVGIPGLAPGMVTANLKVIQAPEMTCGRRGETSMPTSQVTLNLTVNLPATGIPLGLLGVLNTASTFTATVNLAQATGTLTGITCGPGATDGGIDVRVDSLLSKVTTSLHVDIKSLGLTVATVDTGSGGTALASTSTVSIHVPPDTYDTPKSTGPAAAFTSVNNITSTDVHLLGLSAGVVGNVVTGVNTGIIQAYVNPLTVNLNNYLITPLSQALGLRLAGADVFAVDHPTCGDVSLAG
jgi:uncharacterized membrane protein